VKLVLKNNITKILFGVAIIAFGILFLGVALEFWDINSLHGLWTLIIIIPSIGSMISSGVNVWNTALGALGIWLFIKERGLFAEDKFNAITLSIILIGLGFWIIFGSIKKKKKVINSQNGFSEGNTESRPEYFAIFSGSEQKNISNDFKGGSALAIFGGIDVDLSSACLISNAEFSANAIFGGIEITVPENARIEVNGFALLGGCDNTAPLNNNLSLPTLKINYFAFCGGIDIKRKSL